MRISARNILKGTISAVKEGAVNAVVSIDTGDQVIKSDITIEAVKDLGLAVGKEACAVIKASNILVAAAEAPLANISARNQLAGTIAQVNKGAVNGHVVITLADGVRLTASITNEAIDSLGLAEGQKALAIIKATDVLVAVD
ncbi:MAG: TOBE domain-containing protein [Coriobacteriaceae bacterium]|jgi:molybdate transport system regulatory protein|nr:TOBE domain-containing protein [Coriobacteriaceae bacterium]